YLPKGEGEVKEMYRGRNHGRLDVQWVAVSDPWAVEVTTYDGSESVSTSEERRVMLSAADALRDPSLSEAEKVALALDTLDQYRERRPGHLDNWIS
ncbi:hypothetical protein KIPB_011917, partial [Kipferlia bialata]